MNPLPPIKKALATIEEMMGKFGSEEKREEAAKLIWEAHAKYAPKIGMVLESVTVGTPGVEFFKVDAGVPVVTPPVFAELAKVPDSTAVIAEGSAIWPLIETVTVYANCINPRLLRAKLPDQRDVTMEIRRGCKYRRGQPVKCKRISAENAGNPMYAPC